MLTLTDVLSYAVITGFEVVAFCAMTRGGRSWFWRLFAMLMFVGVDALMELLLRHVRISDELWTAVFFVLDGCVMSAFVVGLSHDSPGRRIFLSIVYCACSTSYASIFNLLAYRAGGESGGNLLGLSDTGGIALALTAVVVLNVAFFFWVMPQTPRDHRHFNWRTPCFVAGMMLVLLLTSGIWPVSVVTAPARCCVPFALLSVALWVGLPILYRSMREYVSRIAAEENAALMMSEVKVRRAALDEARRIRHDRRHHLIVLGNLLVRGQAKEALEYVSSLDDGADPGAAAHVWCANETINALLAGYTRKAAEKGVDFAAEAHVERTVPLPDAELVTVVANLVENAVNACGEVEGSGPKAERRSVRVNLRQRGELFGLTVTNDVPPDFRLARSGLPCDEPGVGLDSVRHVIERRSGEWMYTLSDGRLTCELALCGGGGT